ncbi:hypothetical protein SLS62_001088 [Diatrype stigma]|uniref:Uncharacterized protein n=1 Tax=Diatrype stigma TaxID=117547 RepID=A0AAN9YX62_9PEZI
MAVAFRPGLPTTGGSDEDKAAAVDRQPNKQMISLQVRPRALESNMFKVSFDADRMQAKIPDPLPPSSAGPEGAAAHTFGPPHGPNRHSGGRRTAFPAARQQSAPIPRHRSGRARSGVPPCPRDFSTREGLESLLSDPGVIPIYYGKRTRDYFPVLTSLLERGHAKKGDVILMPLPYPEAWPQTVQFVYTQKAELLAEEVQANISYLFGQMWM